MGNNNNTVATANNTSSGNGHISGHAPLGTHPNGQLPAVSTNTTSANEKEHLALSELLHQTLSLPLWHFRSRFERILLFIVFIVCVLCVVLLVLMVLLLLNTSLLKGKQMGEKGKEQY